MSLPFFARSSSRSKQTEQPLCSRPSVVFLPTGRGPQPLEELPMTTQLNLLRLVEGCREDAEHAGKARQGSLLCATHSRSRNLVRIDPD